MVVDMREAFQKKIVANQSALPYEQLRIAIKEHDNELQVRVLEAWQSRQRSVSR